MKNEEYPKCDIECFSYSDYILQFFTTCNIKPFRENRDNKCILNGVDYGLRNLGIEKLGTLNEIMKKIELYGMWLKKNKRKDFNKTVNYLFDLKNDDKVYPDEGFYTMGPIYNVNFMVFDNEIATYYNVNSNNTIYIHHTELHFNLLILINETPINKFMTKLY